MWGGNSQLFQSPCVPPQSWDSNFGPSPGPLLFLPVSTPCTCDDEGAFKRKTYTIYLFCLFWRGYGERVCGVLWKLFLFVWKHLDFGHREACKCSKVVKIWMWSFLCHISWKKKKLSLGKQKYRAFSRGPDFQSGCPGVGKWHAKRDHRALTFLRGDYHTHTGLKTNTRSSNILVDVLAFLHH